MLDGLAYYDREMRLPDHVVIGMQPPVPPPPPPPPPAPPEIPD